MDKPPTKVVILGDSGVGKTCFVSRLANRSFNTEVPTTTGVEFITIVWRDTNVQIWDTAGQEKYREMTTSYLRGADGFFILFDISSLPSFDNVLTWKNAIKTCTEQDIPTFLIATKIDCPVNKRCKTDEELEAFSKENGFCAWACCSAMENHGVETTFDSFMNTISTSAAREDLDVERDEAPLLFADRHKCCCALL
ncbi:rab family GTPase [Pelomyxa schiedti]|nr:rab family GTPase [Pelomyxa schiedti]